MLNKLKRFFESIESKTIGFGWWAVIFLSIIMVRNLLESVLGVHKCIGFLQDQHLSILSLLHFNIYYFSQCLILILILRVLTKERIEKISKVCVLFWTITWLPPIFDYFFTGGQGHPIQYTFTMDEMWRLVIHCANPWVSFPESASPGIRIEFILVSLLSVVYVFTKTRHILKALLSMILFYLSFTIYAVGFLTIFANIVMALFPQGSMIEPGATVRQLFYTPSPFHSVDQKFSLVFLFVISICLFVWYALYNRTRCWAMLKNMRPWRSLHYVLLTAGGVVLGYAVLNRYIPTAFSNPLDYIACFGLCLSVFFAFQSMVVVNDIFDIKADRISNPHRPLVQGTIPEGEYKSLGIVFFSLACLLAFNIRYVSWLILLSFIALYLIYSTPLLHLKRLWPFNMMIIGLNSLMALMVGFSIFADYATLQKVPTGFLILVPLGFFLAGHIITLKDREADKATGIITLPTLLGEIWGKRVIAVLVLCAYLLVPICLGTTGVLIGVSLGFGLLASGWVLRKRWQETPFFLTYFFYLVVLVLILFHAPERYGLG